MNYLHPRNWSKYNRRVPDDRENVGKYKRVILLSQFTLIGSIAGLLHALEDLVDGLVFMPLMDGIMAVSIFTCYLLNENDRHRLARIALLSFLNIFFFIYSSLAHPDLGIYLFYFSWVGLAAVVFDNDENVPRFFFIALSIFLVILLFITDFRIFGNVPFPAIDLERSFIINFVTSISVLVFFIVFMVHMNDQSEQKLNNLALEVQQKNAELERANRELDRFFYSTSHDLKVPLLDLKGALKSAMTEFDDEKVLAYLEVLKQRADKLDLFLQDVIDYARNAQTEIWSEPVNVVQLVDTAIDNFTFVIGADNISFIKDIRVDGEVEGDRVRLMIILNNILSNAIKYHRLGQPNLWVKIHAELIRDKLIITISDNGTGIDADLQPKIFNMFFRGTNKSKGSGLGLYIVKQTVEKMNGTIEVRSRSNAGSQFIIIIPSALVKYSVARERDLSQADNKEEQRINC